MICELTANGAAEWFLKLPLHRRIATLSPSYVDADAKRDKSLKPVFLLFSDQRGFWLHSAHLSAIPGVDRFDIQSPYGYGGPVTDCDHDGFREDAWKAYCEWCNRRSVAVEFLRLHPMAPWQQYPARIVNDRQTVIINLAGRYREAYEPRCRTAVRKAEKSGVSARVYPLPEIASRFAAFYREGMARIEAAEFYMFGDDYFQALARMPDITLLVCERDDEWLAAGLFLAGGKGLEYHLSATTDAGRQASATNLLIDAAAEFGAQQGLAWLYLGGGTDADESNPLLKFKAGFSPDRRSYAYGFHIHDVACYEAMRARSGSMPGRVLFYR